MGIGTVADGRRPRGDDRRADRHPLTETRRMPDPGCAFFARVGLRAHQPPTLPGQTRSATAVAAALIWAAALTPAIADDGPLAPADAATRFVIHEDLELDQVLAEPLVRQPVSLNF